MTVLLGESLWDAHPTPDVPMTAMRWVFHIIKVNPIELFNER